MSKLKEIYKRNVYGVMGTLVFHILLVSSFLLADVDMKGNVKEKEIVVEFPDILPELEEPQPEEPQQDENSAQESAEDYSTLNQSTNVASNRLAEENDFFDEEYQQELAAARQLSSEVSSQLSKEIMEVGDVKMPVEITEGMDPDSLKNIVNTGESNIEYFLEGRYHLIMPKPIYLAMTGGKVIVDIVVNRQGKVVEATVRKNALIQEEQIYYYAELAALNTVFNSDLSAPERQVGEIHYTFIAQ